MAGESRNKTPGWVLSIPHEVCLYRFTRQIEREEDDERKDGEHSSKERAWRRRVVCKCRWAILIRVCWLLIDCAADED